MITLLTPATQQQNSMPQNSCQPEGQLCRTSHECTEINNCNTCARQQFHSSGGGSTPCMYRAVREAITAMTLSSSSICTSRRCRGRRSWKAWALKEEEEAAHERTAHEGVNSGGHEGAVRECMRIQGVKACDEVVLQGANTGG